MTNQNDPARKGEAVVCLLGGDTDGFSIRTARVQLLHSRYGIPSQRCGLIANLVWGAAA